MSTAPQSASRRPRPSGSPRPRARPSVPYQGRPQPTRSAPSETRFHRQFRKSAASASGRDVRRGRFDAQWRGDGVSGAARTGLTAIGGGILADGAALEVGTQRSVGMEFERLRTALATVTGSTDKGRGGVRPNQTICKKHAVRCYSRSRRHSSLRARGLDASLPSLQAYGDGLVGHGQKPDDMVKQRRQMRLKGNFERLKEFRIDAL